MRTNGAARPPRLRMGVLGCASIARRRTLPAMTADPAVQLVAVASRDGARAAAFAREFGCEAIAGYARLLERDDIDAVYLPLPPALRAEWIARALAAGKHVLAEKPLALSHPEATSVVGMARSLGLLLMENFAFLHHSQHATVRNLVESGRIGEVRAFAGCFGFPPLDPGDIRYRAALGGGALLDAGVYPLRAAQLFLGAQLDVAGAHLHVDPKLGVDLRGGALLVGPNGATAQVTFGFEHAYQASYTLWGSTGRLRVTRAYSPPDSFAPTIHIWEQGRTEELTLRADQQFANMIAAFARTALAGDGFDAHDGPILRQAALVDQVRAQAGHCAAHSCEASRTS